MKQKAMARTQLCIPEDLKDWLLGHAHSKGMSMAELVRKIAGDFMAKEKKWEKAKQGGSISERR